MELIPWNDNYKVNIQEIDNQHKGLFMLLNGLHDSMMAGKAKDELDDVLDHLVDYTKKHFAAEEKLMVKFAYPDYDKHKLEHDSFVQKVDHFKEEIGAGKRIISAEILTFLRDWLVNHILKTDKEYQSFFEGKV